MVLSIPLATRRASTGLPVLQLTFPSLAFIEAAILFLETINWHDGLVVDKLWERHSKFWLKPGIGNIPHVQAWPQMLKKHLLLTAIWAIGTICFSEQQTH